jgi:outer membrane protein OmpA-like peptidoglycan-associated protein
MKLYQLLFLVYFMVISAACGNVEYVEEHETIETKAAATTKDQCCNNTLSFTLPNLEFIFDTDILTDDSQEHVDELILTIQGLTDIKSVEVVGHTDWKGSESYNQRLSEQRAEAVKKLLVEFVPLPEKHRNESWRWGASTDSRK